MKVRNKTTGEEYETWEATPCDVPFKGCRECQIHKKYDGKFNKYTYCGEIIEQYPEAAELLGYELINVEED